MAACSGWGLLIAYSGSPCQRTSLATASRTAKGGGEVAVKDLAGGVLAFFGVAGGDNADAPIALFGCGGAAFFHVVQQGGGEEDVLGLRV